METISFERAPVIEIVAELRWNPPGMITPQAGLISVGGTAAEEFCLRFARDPRVSSFAHAEKLIPAGFPAIWQQIMWRLKKPSDASTLLQVGPGIFTANALQPYRRWRDFRPTVESGVTALLSARDPAEQYAELSSLSLRYINGFTDTLTEGAEHSTFVRDVLGFQIGLPNAIRSHIGGDPKHSTLTLLSPVANTTKMMSVFVGDGIANNTPATMYDITVSESSPVFPRVTDVMKALDESRDIIHSTFVNLTRNIHDRMKPLPERDDAT